MRGRTGWVWAISTITRASVLLPSVAGANLALQRPHLGRLALTGLAWLLFVSGVASFVTDAALLARSTRGNPAVEGYRALTALCAASGAVVALAVSASWLSVCLLSAGGSLVPRVAGARSAAIRAGRVARPYASGMLRDAALAAGWLLATRDHLDDGVAEAMVATSLGLGCVLPLLPLRTYMHRQGVRPTLGARSAVLMAGFGLHSFLPTGARVAIAHGMSAIQLASFEMSERVNYLVVSGLLGGLGSELQRRWSLDRSRLNARREVVALGAVLALVGVIGGAVVGVIGHSALSDVSHQITRLEWLTLSLAMGFVAGCGGLLTVLVRWEMANSRGDAVGRRLLGATPIAALGLLIASRYDSAVFVASALALYLLVVTALTIRAFQHASNSS